MDAATSLFGQAGTLGISAIKIEEQYLAALDRITELCDAEPYYPECNELEFLGMQVEAYEAQLP
jgi:antitoxin component HigA of HigAB toxin-antitoxin module